MEDKLFCGPCYFEEFGEKCANCGKTCAGVSGANGTNGANMANGAKQEIIY